MSCPAAQGLMGHRALPNHRRCEVLLTSLKQKWVPRFTVAFFCALMQTSRSITTSYSANESPGSVG